MRILDRNLVHNKVVNKIQMEDCAGKKSFDVSFEIFQVATNHRNARIYSFIHSVSTYFTHISKMNFKLA